MPIPNRWGTKNKDSSLTGIFPGALSVAGKVEMGVTLATAGSPGKTGVFIPFADITGIDNVDRNEIGGAAGTTAIGRANEDAGGARFLLGVLEASYAAQQNSAVADRLTNCTMTRSSLSVVDEDTLQKTFTVKFKLNHTSQDIEAE